MFIFLCWPSYLLLLSNVFVHVCVCLCLSIYVCICRCLSACLCRYGGANVSPGPPRPSLCGPFPPTENLRHQRRALQIRYGNYSCINTTIGSLRLLIQCPYSPPLHFLSYFLFQQWILVLNKVKASDIMKSAYVQVIPVSQVQYS